MRFLFTIFLLIVTLTTVAQARYTVEGTIYNSDTKEILPGVSVGIAELPQQGDFTNESGKYKVTLPQGEYTLVLRLLGYYTKQIKIKLDKSKIQNADLDMEDVSLNEVEISAIHTDANIKGV
ncbi:carboxypeptidase-like regulatory domain-containing protein [Dysgonomonas sp.]